MAKSITDFQNELEQALRPVQGANDALANYDALIRDENEKLDAARNAYQEAISVVLAEKVFTREFLEDKGYVKAAGKHSVAVADVEVKHVSFDHLGEYINDVFSRLASLKDAYDKQEKAVESVESQRDEYYVNYARQIHTALDSGIVARSQLKVLGLTIPPKSVLTRSESQDVETEQSYDE